LGTAPVTLRAVADNDFAVMAGTATTVTRVLFQNSYQWGNQIALGSGIDLQLSGEETHVYLVVMDGGGGSDFGGTLNGVDLTAFTGAERAVVETSYKDIRSSLTGYSNVLVENGTYSVLFEDVKKALEGSQWAGAVATGAGSGWMDYRTSGVGSRLTGRAWQYPVNSAVVFRYPVRGLGNVLASSLDTDGDGVTDFRESRDGTNPSDAQSFQPLSRGLVAYYPFNGNAKDESGFNNDGTVKSATLAADRFGNLGSAYFFDGLSSSVEVADSPSLRPQKEVTVSVWVNIDVGQTYKRILTKGVNINDSHGSYQLITGSNLNDNFHDDPLFTIQTTAGYRVPDPAHGQPTAKWIHVVGVNDGLKAKLYYNGAFAAEVDSVGSLRYDNNSLVIGGDLLYPSSFFKGSIDDVRIYNRALSASEVAALYGVESAANSSAFVSVSAGNRSSVAVAADGGVYTWGANTSWQLGYSTVSEIERAKEPGRSAAGRVGDVSTWKVPVASPLWGRCWCRERTGVCGVGVGMWRCSWVRTSSGRTGMSPCRLGARRLQGRSLRWRR
jgi:hypothetical protein